MKYLSEAFVYITIFGDDFSPNLLTQLLDITPTKVVKKGDKGQYTKYLKECFWQYQLDTTDVIEGLDASLNRLIEIFESKTTLICDFMLEHRLKAKCFVVIKSRNKEDVGVSLTPRFIEFLGSLNATIEIDVYVTDNVTSVE